MLNFFSNGRALCLRQIGRVILEERQNSGQPLSKGILTTEMSLELGAWVNVFLIIAKWKLYSLYKNGKKPSLCNVLI
jgi:hypothetical protein